MAKSAVLFATVAGAAVAGAALLVSAMADGNASAATAAMSMRVGIVWFAVGGVVLLVSIAIVARLRARVRRVATPRATTVVPVLVEV